MARLAHPNVVTVFDAGKFGNEVFVAMEFVSGLSLRQWMNERPRSSREIRDVFLAAGRGLEAAHAAGVVHRDFKPDNVMVAEDGRARVTDFGLARAGIIQDQRQTNPERVALEAGERAASENALRAQSAALFRLPGLG